MQAGELTLTVETSQPGHIPQAVTVKATVPLEGESYITTVEVMAVLRAALDALAQLRGEPLVAPAEEAEVHGKPAR